MLCKLKAVPENVTLTKKKKFNTKNLKKNSLAEVNLKDDEEWFSESEQVNLKALLKDEDGWVFSPLMTVSRLPERLDII